MTRLLLRIDHAARHAVPMALALLLVLISALPATLTVFREVSPAWVLMAVFYWSVYRPDLMPIQAAFVIGLLQDLLLGLPPGISALIYVVLRGNAGLIARLANGRSFLGVWLIFATVTAIATIVRHILMILWFERLIDPTPALVEAMLTIGVYPAVSWVFVRLQRGLLAHA